MILTCPACATRYVIGDDVFQAGVREVRCAKCGHRWTSDGSEAVDEIDARMETTPVRAAPQPESPAAEPVAEPGAKPAAPEEPAPVQAGFGLDEMPGLGRDGDADEGFDADDGFDDDEGADRDAAIVDTVAEDEPEVEELRALPDTGEKKPGGKSAKAGGKAKKSKKTKKAGREKPPRRRTPIWVWIGWVLLMLCAAGLVAALVFLRQPLTEAWPPLQRLYDTVDGAMAAGVSGAAEDHAAQHPVQLSVESSEMTDDQGKRQLSILVRLTNTTAERQTLPIALVHLLREDGKIETSERIRLPSDQPLAPKESRVMALRLSDVPASVASVKAEAESPDAD